MLEVPSRDVVDTLFAAAQRDGDTKLMQLLERFFWPFRTIAYGPYITGLADLGQVGRCLELGLVGVGPLYAFSLVPKLTSLQSSGSNVLIMGETGTGKEVVARALHATGPFEAINCAAIPSAMMESELFGHEKGAFTGATKKASGIVARAEGGTLFLDEIGEMPLDLQAKMLRFAQDGTYHPLGGTAKQASVRLLCATNVDLPAAVKGGDFREDLYHRLSEQVLEIPPLRLRVGDIPILVYFFIEEYNRETDAGLTHVTRWLLVQALEHSWRGNIRELRNRVREACAQAVERRLPTVSRLSVHVGDGATHDAHVEMIARPKNTWLPEADDSVRLPDVPVFDYVSHLQGLIGPDKYKQIYGGWFLKHRMLELAGSTMRLKRDGERANVVAQAQTTRSLSDLVAILLEQGVKMSDLEDEMASQALAKHRTFVAAGSAIGKSDKTVRKWVGRKDPGGPDSQQNRKYSDDA